MPEIAPTVGRIVHVYVREAVLAPDSAPGERAPLATCGPFPAIITHVAEGAPTIGIDLFGRHDLARETRWVPLVQADEVVPADAMMWAEWMPYQKGQAQRTEQAEKALAGAQPLGSGITPGDVVRLRSDELSRAPRLVVTEIGTDGLLDLVYWHPDQHQANKIRLPEIAVVRA